MPLYNINEYVFGEILSKHLLTLPDITDTKATQEDLHKELVYIFNKMYLL